MTAPQLPFPRSDVLSVGPLYAQLRATAPLCAVRTPAGDPAWLVTSHALTRELLAVSPLLTLVFLGSVGLWTVRRRRLLKETP